jgi:hypothetical protein
MKLDRIPLELLPEFIEIETSTYCNRSCWWCPNSIYINRSKIQRLISPDLFKKIILDLKNLEYKGQIALHNYNEPLYDPKLFKHISLIREKLPDANVLIFTNGDILDRIYCEKLEKKGVSYVRITLHDAIYSQRPYEILYKHIKKLGLDKNKIKDISDWLGRKFQINFGKMSIIYYIPYKEMLTSRGGIIPNMDETEKQEICFLPFVSSAIDYEGNMKICCEIYPEHKLHKEKGIVGKLSKKSFFGLWFSEFYNDLRRKILSKNIDNEICSHCPKNGLRVNYEKLKKWKKFLDIA